MAERVEREPTLEEIVVALRETRRGAGRSSGFTVVGEQPGNRSSNVAPRGSAHARNGLIGATGISDLRDCEIDRLLAENARLNRRIAYLLKLIERERARTVEPAADPRGIAGEVRMTLEAELRPVLLVLLRLLQAQRPNHAGPAASTAAEPNRGTASAPAARPSTSDAASRDAGWVVDLDALRD